MSDSKHEGPAGGGTGFAPRPRVIVAGALAVVAAGALVLYAMGGTEAGPVAPATSAATQAATTASQPADDGRVAGALPGEGNTSANCEWHVAALSVGGYDYFYSASVAGLCRVKVGTDKVEVIREDPDHSSSDSASEADCAKRYEISGLCYDDGRLYLLEELGDANSATTDRTIKSIALDGSDERTVIEVPDDGGYLSAGETVMYLYQHKVYLVSGFIQDEEDVAGHFASQVACCNTDGTGYEVLSTISNKNATVNATMAAGRVYYSSVECDDAGGSELGKATVCSQAPDGSDCKVLYEGSCDELYVTVVGSKLICWERVAASASGAGEGAVCDDLCYALLTMDLDGGNVANLGMIDGSEWPAGYGAKGIYLGHPGNASEPGAVANAGSAQTGGQAAGPGAFSLVSYETGEKNDFQTPLGIDDENGYVSYVVADAGDRAICMMSLSSSDGPYYNAYMVGAMNADGTDFVPYVVPKG